MRLPSINSATAEILKAGLIAAIAAFLSALLSGAQNNPDAFGPYTVVLVSLLQFARAFFNKSVPNW